MTHKFIPPHLRQFIVDQEYDRYTAIDHAVWRYIMRISIDFFKDHAHASYLEGLEKSGVSIDVIPIIDDMDLKLSEFGWGAVCVRGFIPPAAFMELQSLGILPIAADMRTIDHLTYTPAPDIVHEAAGHAPILANQEYADYLRKYGEIANKAIASDKDLAVYYAIRELSDIKENPASDNEMILKAEDNLNNAIANVNYVSEAAYLSRMNWWTVEYGLMGNKNNFKIYGAGLLSSVGESQNCLSESITKIPFSIDCINKSYNITEPQPQLFITPSFGSLSNALDEMKEQMAFYLGGRKGLQKAIDSKTICTIEFDSNIQVSGIVNSFMDNNNNLSYIQLSGPVQLCRYDNEIPLHGASYHLDGYGTTIGKIKNFNKSIFDFNDDDIQKLNLFKGESVEITFESSITVKGKINNILQKNGRILLLSFIECRVKYKDKILFKPSWGTYDMICGNEIISVYGGPADFEPYSTYISNECISAVKRIYTEEISDQDIKLNDLYKQVNDMRENNVFDIASINIILEKLGKDFKDDWLLKINILELSINNDSEIKDLFNEINLLVNDSEIGQVIKRGLDLIN